MNVRTELTVVLKDARILSVVTDVFVVRDTDGLVQHVKVRKYAMWSCNVHHHKPGL